MYEHLWPPMVLNMTSQCKVLALEAAAVGLQDDNNEHLVKGSFIAQSAIRFICAKWEKGSSNAVRRTPPQTQSEGLLFKYSQRDPSSNTVRNILLQTQSGRRFFKHSKEYLSSNTVRNTSLPTQSRRPLFKHSQQDSSSNTVRKTRLRTQ